ncbi:MAG: Fe-S cluster assembly protein SufD [Chlamydiales bacterium]|nr:Fe-S cluster assembly protein SufD [Chlamydiales bacterium]
MLETLEKEVTDREAWGRFQELGFPTKEWELFRYVRLSDLYARPFSKAREAALELTPKEGQLVFVNGRYHENLSRLPRGIVVQPLLQAKKTYGGFLIPRLEAQLREEKDPFAALNGALAEGALFIYLPPKTVSAFTIIHHLTPQANPAITAPRFHLYAGKEAEAKIVISHQAQDWVNSFADFALDERASVKLVSRFEADETSWQFDAIRATLKRESRFTSCAVVKGGATLRLDYGIRLMEERAEASLYGLCRPEERSHHHVNVLMKHEAPRCRSLQHFKNVLKGISRTSFEGKIHVDRLAQKTEAFQMNNNLILSPRASANSKPNLEIFADDVKASHGATVGQIDEEQLFYLKTRGIPLAQAKELLVEGFCREILEGPYADMCRLS